MPKPLLKAAVWVGGFRSVVIVDEREIFADPCVAETSDSVKFEGGEFFGGIL